MFADCPYVVIFRCTQAELEDINRARRADELPGDVLRRRLGLQPDHKLDHTGPKRVPDRRCVVSQSQHVSG
jgi:hypothetical protein